MITFDLSLNIFTLLAIIGLSILVGTLGRGRQLARKNNRIQELEKEMMQAHAELLDMQKNYYELEVRTKERRDPSIPVINIKQTPKEQEVKKEQAPGEGTSTKDRPNRIA